MPHGHSIGPYGPVLLPPATGHPAVPATSPAFSEDIARLIFRGVDSSPTSDVPSLSDGDSDPPSATCEAPELAERWPGSPATAVQSPMVFYNNPIPGFSPPGIPVTQPTYRPWTSPKSVTRSESRRSGMSARKLKALKSETTVGCYMLLLSTYDWCIYQPSNANSSKRTVIVPRAAYARCESVMSLLGTITNRLTRSIHDPSALQAYQSSQGSYSDTSDSPDASKQPSPQPHSKDYERNMFPITWRVIGGGVMMGGQSTYISLVLTLRMLN